MRIVALFLLFFASAAQAAPSVAVAAGPRAQLEACMAAANQAWSETERQAWRSLCTKQTIDLSQGPHQPLAANAKGCSATFATSNEKYPDPAIFEHDDQHLLSGEFLAEILHDHQYSTFLENTPIRIRGAYIPVMHIDNAAITALRIDNSLIGDVELHNVKVESSIAFCDSTKIKNRLVLSNVTAPDADLYKVAVLSTALYGLDPCLAIENSTFLNLSIVFVDAIKIEVSATHVDNLLFFNANTSKSLSIRELNAGDIYIPGGKASHVVLSTVDLKHGVSIGNIQWESFPPRADPPAAGFDSRSDLSVSRLTAQRFSYSTTGRNPDLPAKIDFRENAIASIFLGSDPLAWLQRISEPPETVLDVYDTTAKTYAARSRASMARQVLYQREILADAAAYDASDWTDMFRHGGRVISRALVGYGYYPERGLLAILGFVLIAWPVFATGGARITSDTRPHSWFIFSLDTIIPILALDPRDASVTFSGSRQYFLYFMRLLGAGLVFLVIAYLKQAIFGPG